MIGFWSITIRIYIQYFHCLGYVLLQGYFYLIVGRFETKVVFSRKWVVIFFLTLNWIVRMIHLKFHRDFRGSFILQSESIIINCCILSQSFQIGVICKHYFISWWERTLPEGTSQSVIYLHCEHLMVRIRFVRFLRNFPKFCSPLLYFANIIYPISSSIDDSYK